MLGKTIKTLGKMTAECHPRHSSLAKDLDDRYIFSECFLSSVESTLGKKKKEVQRRRENANSVFAKCLHGNTLGKDL